MRRILFSLFLSLFLSLGMNAAEPVLRFHSDSSFKIVQLTDMHLAYYNKECSDFSDGAFRRMSYIVRQEKPDLIMLTGDIVTAPPASPTWKRLLDSLAVYNVPFCVCLGNHDAEADLSRVQIADEVLASPLTLNRRDSSGELADVSFPILSSYGSNPSFQIYCMDSHDYSAIKSVSGYGWFSAAQVQWFRDEEAKAQKASSAGQVPGLVFFHIPTPEYVFSGDKETVGYVGRKAEDVCPQAVNTGLFASMVESGSIAGAFCGHDHDNDYILPMHGVMLGYGRFSGSDTIYNNLVPGARVILLKEGVKGFRTWIREWTGRKSDDITAKGGKLVQE